MAAEHGCMALHGTEAWQAAEAGHGAGMSRPSSAPLAQPNQHPNNPSIKPQHTSDHFSTDIKQAVFQQLSSWLWACVHTSTTLNALCELTVAEGTRAAHLGHMLFWWPVVSLWFWGVDSLSVSVLDL